MKRFLKKSTFILLTVALVLGASVSVYATDVELHKWEGKAYHTKSDEWTKVKTIKGKTKITSYYGNNKLYPKTKVV